MAALFGKKDQNEPDVPQPTGEEEQTPLKELSSQLGKLGGLFTQANQQIVEYLVQRESQFSGGEGGESAAVLARKIDSLSEKLDRLTSGTTTPGPANAAPGEQSLDALAPLYEKLDRLESSMKAPADASSGTAGDPALEAIRQLRVQLDGGIRHLSDLLAPQSEPVEESSGPAGSSDWERAILGPDLVEYGELAFQRRQLTEGVLGGDPGACALAGQLLVFQSAAAERLPQVLKDIGEAFYRWQPKVAPGMNPMEETLAKWLRASCEAAGIYNTIELVHPGERFDSSRHTASSRGVEITQVHGWIVLRDNGKVYTKATVSVH